jgi:hypothetical protein
MELRKEAEGEQVETSENIVEVNGTEIDLTEGSEDMDLIGQLRNLRWNQRVWEPSGAWLFSGPNGEGKIRGSAAEPIEEEQLAEMGLLPGTELQYVEGAWNQDHCEICTTEIPPADDPETGEAWAARGSWVCGECFRLFLAEDAVFAAKFPPIERDTEQFDADSELTGT